MASRVTVRAYRSPAMVLLALDWPAGATRADFLGFAISRTPGFGAEATSWLPNRIGFHGPAPDGGDLPSDANPIQKFLWWDARFAPGDQGVTYSYRVRPVVGSAEHPHPLASAARSVRVKLPANRRDGIGTWFNRAVVASQGFVKQFGHDVTPAELPAAQRWLSNGIEGAFAEVLGPPAPGPGERIAGAVYHLHDPVWVQPALATAGAAVPVELVVHDDAADSTNAEALAALTAVTFLPRRHGNLMHDKFLVRSRAATPGSAPVPDRLLTGSANFTTEGLTTQANLLHTFDSSELAARFLAREQLLATDPTPAVTAAAAAGWSPPIAIGPASVRVLFSPEPAGARVGLDTITAAVQATSASVLFCLFSPTDTALLDTLRAHATAGHPLFGLVNALSATLANGEPAPGATSTVRVYHRTIGTPQIVEHSVYAKGTEPQGFWWESVNLPGAAATFPVYVHHKFVIVGPETLAPRVFTGSANLSENSTHRNDENLLEIRSGDVAAVYLAEGLRLYEHYRARAAWNDWVASGHNPATYSLRPDASWARKAFTAGTSEFASRVGLAAPAT